MRVLMIVPGWPSTFRPHFMPWLYHQCQGLARDHDITVVILASLTHFTQPKYRMAWIRERSLPVFHQTSPKVRLVPVWYVSLPRLWLYRQVTFPLLWMSFQRALRQVDLAVIDVIHAHFSSPAGTIARRLSNLLQKPYIVTEHASDFEHLLRTGIEVEEVIGDADRVLCVSPLLAEKIRSSITLERDNLQVVPNGVDLSLFQPAGRPRHRPTIPHLLFVGHLIPRKGLHVLLDALAILRAKGLRCTLRVVGDGPEKAKLVRKVAALGLSNEVRFVGLVPNHEMPWYYQSADLLVLPSYEESFGVTVIEALACGIPVVTTRCGGPEAIVSDSVGKVIEPGNVDQLVDAIQEVCSEYASYDPYYLREYVLNRYSLPAVVDRIGCIYQEVVSCEIRGRQ